MKLTLSRAACILTSTWLFVGSVVIATAYSSQLTASLTVRHIALPFTSMKELVNQRTYTWGVSSGTALQSILQDSHNEIYSKFHRGLMQFSKTDPDVLSRSTDVQIDKVLTEKYAYLVGSDKLLTLWQARNCGIEGIPVLGFQKPAVFYLQKHSPYTEMFSEAMGRMQETGLVTYLIQKWTPEKKRCEPRGLTSAISLEQAKTAFYVLGIGTALALVSVALEIWVACIRKQYSCVISSPDPGEGVDVNR